LITRFFAVSNKVLVATGLADFFIQNSNSMLHSPFGVKTTCGSGKYIHVVLTLHQEFQQARMKKKTRIGSTIVQYAAESQDDDSNFNNDVKLF